MVLSSHGGSLYGDGTLVCLDSLVGFGPLGDFGALVHNDTIVTNGSLLLFGATSNVLVHFFCVVLSG